MEQVTYGSLKKPITRKEMLEESIVSLGTKAGNYGLFTEEARILTLIGAKEIKEEVRALSGLLNRDGHAILSSMPTLYALLK